MPMALVDQFLPDELWERIAPMLPVHARSPQGGRPPADTRATLAGILWMLRTGSRWKDLPEEFPHSSTCWRRFRAWQQQGVLDAILAQLSEAADDSKISGRFESYADGTFKAAKKGGTEIGVTKAGKGNKIMLVVNSHGVPRAALLAPANPAEVNLIEPTLEQSFSQSQEYDILIYDKAADSDPLRNRLKDLGIELICPHRKNRTAEPTQDRRKLKRYKRRSIVERTFAWLDNFRRLVARYEWYAEMFMAFIQMACILILMRRLYKTTLPNN